MAIYQNWGSLKADFPAISGVTKQVETIKGNLTFEATPEDATAIIAALESDPAVECIRTLRINAIGGSKVEVRMDLEAWVFNRPTRRGGSV